MFAALTLTATTDCDSLARRPLGRDSVAVYDALHKAGLQYGPAFQLLTNIHVPDSSS